MGDQEMNSNGEVESALQLDNQCNNNKSNNPFPSLGRQSSIYSLTLDEFQHTLCGEGGKNFGSMNMDEFLNSIWTAEENQHPNPAAGASVSHAPLPGGGSNGCGGSGDHPSGKGIAKQPSLPRQGSLTLPEKLCRKTVDEVWSEIHSGNRKFGGGQRKSGDNNEANSNSNSQVNVRNNSESTPRQPTFGEMTLEDFLIKAGVVREQQCGGGGGAAAAPSLPPPQQYGMFLPRGGGSVAYPSPPLPPYSGRVENGCVGGGGYAPPPPPPSQSLPVVGPVSPVSSDGMAAAANIDVVGNHYGMDMSGLRGRKRIIDGPVEKVVERRQRRMIKNRESAARSRARKQAYTVELEAELNQLKEENRQLKQALAEMERKRKQQYLEEMRSKGQSKAREKLMLMRRNLSCQL